MLVSNLFVSLSAMVPRFYEIRERPGKDGDGSWEEEKEGEEEVEVRTACHLCT